MISMMSKEDVRAHLGDLIVLDVRTSRDWEGSDRKIAGAIRENPEDVRFWAPKYPRDTTIVAYCA